MELTERQKEILEKARIPEIWEECTLPEGALRLTLEEEGVLSPRCLELGGVDPEELVEKGGWGGVFWERGMYGGPRGWAYRRGVERRRGR